MSRLRIKNWDKFQHYKNRRPPWIKLYRELLDDPDWHSLDGDTSKFVVMCWLIASENEQGYLPAIEKLAFRLRMQESQVKSLLLKAEQWIDSSMLAECLQDATPEGEREGETETEGEGDSVSTNVDTSRQQAVNVPYQAIVNLYHETLPTLPQCKTLTPKRKGQIRQRHMNGMDKNLDNWRAFFEAVGRSPFLMGNTQPFGDRKPFRATLDWITKQDNYAKILEGKYHG